MKTKKKRPQGGVTLETNLGKVIPIVGVQYNPTHEWMDKVYRFHSILDQKKKYTEPHYGGSKIEAVIMEGKNLELSDPKTACCTQYKYINWPGDTTALRVYELEDGTLWEEMTETQPMSLDPGQSIISGRHWRDDWLCSSKARDCLKVLGPAVTMLYFVHRLSDRGLELHKSRLPRRRK